MIVVSAEFEEVASKAAWRRARHAVTSAVMFTSDLEQDARIRPIASAATATRYIETAEMHHGQMQTQLSDEFARLHGVHFRAMNITTTVRHHTVKDAMLDTDTLALLQDGLTLPETVYFLPPHRSDRPTAKVNSLVRLDGSEDIIIGYNNAHTGYQHWLTQCIPAIDWSLRQSRARPIRLLLPPLIPWQEETLDILGYQMIPRLVPEAGKQYFLPHAEYTEFLNGSTAFGICLSTLDTAQRILTKVPATASPHRVVYVPYANPYYGSIVNAAEVLDLLQRHGVFIVDERRESVAERVNLFRHADVVIGPHGEGLTDVLFCKPGALLWEWMPRHFQNASMNRLAQAARVDYWGDLLEPVAELEAPGRLRVDLIVVERRLAEISQRLALRAAASDSDKATEGRPGTVLIAGKPIDELMLAFESLGDNCEFGLVQRYGRVEPLGLLRFAGIFLPTEDRLPKLVAALHGRFAGLGAPGTITVELAGASGQREFMVHESVYSLRYHSGVGEEDIEPAALREREAKRLTFLRHKLLEDLQSGNKIWVWRSQATSAVTQVQPLLDVLRTFGPNVLLWVVEATGDHGPGTIERLDRDFIKGYIERFAPYDNATDIRPLSWFEVCLAADKLCHPDQPQPESVEIATALSRQPLPAMDFLAQHAADIRPVPQPVPTPRVSKFHRLLAWLGFRSG